MGEVYRARDPRLGREVAIKVLPASFAQDADRLTRFEQEARAASALNHPNIVTIHEIGDAIGSPYIAMELVEGASLRELLAAGALPTKKLLDVAVQIAEGLAKAHAAGIVHRDLKPENVMVTRDGFVKILDFGLAKLFTAPQDQITGAPTAIHQETPARHRHGDGRLHVAGAGEREAGGLPVGPVRAGLDPLRDGDGQARVPEGHGRRDADRDHPRRAGAGRAGQPAGAGAAALDRRALPRQGSRRALRLDAGSRAGLEERARAHRRGHVVGVRRDRRRRAGAPPLAPFLWCWRQLLAVGFDRARRSAGEPPRSPSQRSSA